MTRCKKCGEYPLFPESHKCAPAWLVWCLDDGESIDDARTVNAHDAEAAAEKWAEFDDWDSGEHRIVGGQTVKVCAVLDNTDNEPKTLEVEGEPVPTYNATEVSP